MLQFRGDYLKALRKERGVRQAEVGQAVGVSGAAVGSYERGVNTPPAPVVDKLAEFFGVSASSFWQDETGKVGNYTVSSQGDLLRLLRDLIRSQAVVQILPDNTAFARISFPIYGGNGTNATNAQLINALKGLKALFAVDCTTPDSEEWQNIIDTFVDTNAAKLDSEELDCGILPF